MNRERSRGNIGLAASVALLITGLQLGSALWIKSVMRETTQEAIDKAKALKVLEDRQKEVLARLVEIRELQLRNEEKLAELHARLK